MTCFHHSSHNIAQSGDLCRSLPPIQHFYWRIKCLKSYEAPPASLTCTALQRDALAVSELVSWAAVETVICCRADYAVRRTGFTPSPCRVEEPLRTDISTLSLEEVPGHPEFVWVEQEKERKCVRGNVLRDENTKSADEQNRYADSVRQGVIHMYTETQTGRFVWQHIYIMSSIEMT